MKEVEAKYEGLNTQFIEKMSKIDILEMELSQVKHKVIESEYAAFCMTLTQDGMFNTQP